MRYRVPRSFRDADRALLSPELLAQIKVAALLGYGFVLSPRGIGGIASLAAFVIGLEARRRIKRSGGRLVGIRLAWWCIIFGGFWAVVLPLLIASHLLRW